MSMQLDAPDFHSNVSDQSPSQGPWTDEHLTTLLIPGEYSPSPDIGKVSLPVPELQIADHEELSTPERKVRLPFGAKTKIDSRVNKVANVCLNGRIDDLLERSVIVGAVNHGYDLASNAGVAYLLMQTNMELSGRGSEYGLRFGQNIIKTPGGRRLEIFNINSGATKDYIDFVIRNYGFPDYKLPPEKRQP